MDRRRFLLTSLAGALAAPLAAEAQQAGSEAAPSPSTGDAPADRPRGPGGAKLLP